MLSDYIPVYWPETNRWSVPTYEIEKYIDYCPTPQKMTLHRGHVVEGIPLLHFGTWGIFGVNVTGTIRKIAKNPKTTAKMYKSKEVAADVAAFFTELRRRYPKIVSVEHFGWGRRPESSELNVPVKCIVSYVKPGGKKA